jgi:hypothetical protein
VPTADDRTRMPSTSWTARCSHAGHGTDTRNCTQESTRPLE